MGNTEPLPIENTNIQGKLIFSLKVSPNELESLKIIVNERASYHFEYFCTVSSCNYEENKHQNIFCQDGVQAQIEYQTFDYYLVDLKRHFPLPSIQVERIIYCICEALAFLAQKKIHHGDISLRTICRARNDWKLIDNYFIRGGITAYEKVLEGEEGFISPSQMEKIRHGFVRQSPPIQECDDIFGLGMTCLEMMSGRSSSLCYKQSYIRFNDKNMDLAVGLIQKQYPLQLCNLVYSMLVFKQDQRISLRQILKNPLINRHSKKYSLKLTQR